MQDVISLVSLMKSEMAGGYPAKDNYDFYAHYSSRTDSSGYDLDVERIDVNQLKLVLMQWEQIEGDFSREKLADLLINDEEHVILSGSHIQVDIVRNIFPLLTNSVGLGDEE